MEEKNEEADDDGRWWSERQSETRWAGGRNKVRYQREGVPGGEGEHVGAGDDAEAGLLQPRLGAVDDLEAAEARVRGRVLLRRVAQRRVQQNGRVAALQSVITHQSVERMRQGKQSKTHGRRGR